jgi:hypothetical protein
MLEEHETPHDSVRHAQTFCTRQIGEIGTPWHWKTQVGEVRPSPCPPVGGSSSKPAALTFCRRNGVDGIGEVDRSLDSKVQEQAPVFWTAKETPSCHDDNLLARNSVESGFLIRPGLRLGQTVQVPCSHAKLVGAGSKPLEGHSPVGDAKT